jgi:DNA mismatch repair protein MutS2
MESLLEKALSTLDWPRILDRLCDYVGSQPGRERVQALAFATDLKEIQRLQDQTTEVRALLDTGQHVPIGGIRDIRLLVASAEKGEILAGRELLDVANTLNAAHQLKRFFAGHADVTPTVLSVATRLHDLQELSALLGNSFDSSGELSTALYPQLAQLRNRIHSLHGRIKDRLSNLLGSDEFSGLTQDQFVTVRSERYVIPLKVQARSMDLGIVHDTSGSGQTVFVEPRQVIPLNNELKMTEAELRREERRILQELSRRVSLEHVRILENVELMAELEFIYARARLSQDLQATPPVLVKTAVMRLHAARHPILVLRGLQVVPNDLSIGLDFQALILSGPNTGGKTVALKTLGLCALMTRAGLHIPAEPGSEVGVFRTVVTDIGDQQTVEQDLSTFSGHIVGIRRILESVGNDASQALILLDEIAVGTDPAQGAALARALLESFVECGAKVVVTTHYAELKTLSVQDKRFANGRVEYDAVGLRPTYRVVLGTPGRSYALDIAEKLGIGRNIILRARGYLEGGQRALEDLLGQLETSLSQARDEKILLERARRESEALKGRYESRLVEVEREADRMRRKALERFDAEVKAARDDIARVVRELQKGQGARLVTATEAREKVSEIVRKVQAQAPAAPLDPVKAAAPLGAEQLRIGEKVLVANLRKNGQIASISDDRKTVEVAIGGLRVRVSVNELRQPIAEPKVQSVVGKASDRIETQAARAQARKLGKPVDLEGAYTSTSVSSMPSRSSGPIQPGSLGPDGLPLGPDEQLAHAFQTSSNTLDMRGMRVDEGLAAIERYLDAASLRNESVIFLIHGHGTGAMKAAVRDYLRTSPYVDRYQPGERGQGGDGATVVALK